MEVWSEGEERKQGRRLTYEVRRGCPWWQVAAGIGVIAGIVWGFWAGI